MDHQKQFYQVITGKLATHQFGHQIEAVGQLTKKQALEVYCQDYIARLSESLGHTYEAVWWCLGDKDFFQLAKEYIDHHPSCWPDLSHHGDRLANFLQDHSTAKEFAYLADLARFEWIFRELFHAKEEQGLTSSQLAQALTHENTFLLFNPTLKLIASEYNIYEIWKHRTGAYESDFEINHPLCLAMFKRHGEVKIQLFSHTQFELLEALMREQIFAKALEQFSEGEVQAEDVSAVFEFLALNQLVFKVLDDGRQFCE